MRISDWSSDVCSSDLAECAAGWLNRRENGSRSCHGFTRMTRMTRMTRIKKKKEKKNAMAGRTVQLPGSVLIRVLRVNPWPKEIGRAQCRERVGQYVYISEVAVSLKQKHIHT